MSRPRFVPSVGILLTLTCGVLTGASAAEPPADGIYLPTATGQTETDEYTRYELLAPGSGRFRITYEVTATTAGAKYFYNPIRKGSAASDESVLDAMTGKPLQFEIVSGADARKDALMADADLDMTTSRSTLARPVPTNGQGRLVIVKTYEDREELLRRRQDDRLRPAARRPSQQGRAARGLRSRRPDGAVAGPHRKRRPNRDQLREATEAVRRRSCSARRRARGPVRRPRRRLRRSNAAGNRRSKARRRKIGLSERAHQDRDIVYFLQQPETHAFALYHDYTETRPGVNGYANVVRNGSDGEQSVGEHSRYRRAAAGEGDERRRDDRVEDQRRRDRRSRRARRRDSVSRPCRPDSRCACGSRRPTPHRSATSWTATSWCSTAVSAGRAMPSCCRRVGTAPSARFPRR